jgi:methyl-accepting chemotaxis protein
MATTGNTVSRFRIQELAAFLVLVSLSGFLIISAASFFVNQKVKINGPIYKQIVQGKDLVADILPPPEYIIESYLVVLQALNEPDNTKQQLLFERFRKLKGEYEERHVYWKKALPEGGIKKILLEDSYRPAVVFYDKALNEFFPAIVKGDVKSADAVVKTSLNVAYESHRQQIDRLVKLTTAYDERIENEAASTLNLYSLLLIAICLTMIAACIMVSVFVVRSIRKTFDLFIDITNRIADGDLSVDVPIAGRGRFRTMLVSLHSMVDQLRKIIHQVNGTSSQLLTTAADISSTSVRIAKVSEIVAGNSLTVATAGEQMVSASHSISHNCHIAAGNSEKSSVIATTGVEVVHNTISVMERIAGQVRALAATVGNLGQRSQQIGTIIGTIDDIADQTNLLALNAAIEAARAGEQGRGFAVVADEVRALAERTTKATREIAEMIKVIQTETQGAVKAMVESVSEVESGTVEAGRSGDALQEIFAQVNEVSRQVKQIATAAVDQTTATEQINEGIYRITDLVQETVDGAHTCAGAASQLTVLAQELKISIGQFRFA